MTDNDAIANLKMLFYTNIPSLEEQRNVLNDTIKHATRAIEEYKRLKAENGRLTRELEQAYEQIIKLKGGT